MSAADETTARFPLMKTLKDLGIGGTRIEASILTTYALNAVFYEEVLLRAFERAGSRLNILMVDASQLAAAISDPMRRPQRAGKDYLLVPVAASGAYHPKVLALLGQTTSILAIGSHNATDPGFSRNEEVTGFWGSRSNGAPAAIMEAALDYCLEGLRVSQGLQDPLLSDLQGRLLALAKSGSGTPDPDVSFIGSKPAGLTLWEQLSQFIPSPVRRIYAVGPYFDGELRMLKQMARDLGTAEIIVGLQPSTAILTNPEKAPPNVRFVDSGVLETFCTKGPVGFAHGKALAFETSTGVVVTLGSANPTGAAWLDGEVRNAEANLVLTDEAATRAFETLGLHRLASAPSISGEQLASIVDRSREVRRLERERDGAHPSMPAIAGRRSGEQVFIARVAAADCRGATLLQADEMGLEATFEAADGGALMTTTPRLPSAGLVRIEGEHNPICVLVLNDEPHLQGGTRPKEAARLLENLGRLDDYEGFDELFELFDRYIFADPGEGARASSPTAQPTKQKAPAATDEGKPGPRGVSLLSLEQAETQKRMLEGGLIADCIAALMRDLAPPAPPPPPTDGDGRNLDAEDAAPNELAGDEIATTEAADTSLVDWPRLVKACRVRVGHLLGRLKTKLAEPDTTVERAAWRFVRILTVLCLLQRLRVQAPPVSELSMRSESLVTVDQLRKAFNIALDAIYGPGLLAQKLEISPDHRGAQERGRMDAALLWLAREIGADFLERPGFNEASDHKAQRLQNQADLVVIAMSAAADPDRCVEAIAERPAILSRWADAVRVSQDWGPRHLALGYKLQSRYLDGSLGAGGGAAKAGSFAIWQNEPGLPRLVRTLTGSRATLIEPGGLAADKLVATTYLDGVDATAW